MTWPHGKCAAVSLTFDDARVSQIDQGLSILDAFDVKATFYVSPGNVESRLEGWREAAGAGHEIGKADRHQTVSAVALDSLCEHLKRPDSRLWVETVATVGEHIRRARDDGGEEEP